MMKRPTGWPAPVDFVLLALVAAIMGLMIFGLAGCATTGPAVCAAVAPLEGKVAYPTCATIQFAGKF